MQQDMSPASCEADSFFAVQGVGAFNMKDSCFRMSYNYFDTSKNSSAPMSVVIAEDCLVVSNSLLTTGPGGRYEWPEHCCWI